MMIIEIVLKSMMMSEKVGRYYSNPETQKPEMTSTQPHSIHKNPSQKSKPANHHKKPDKNTHPNPNKSENSTAHLRTLTTISTTLTPLLTNKTTAQRRQTTLISALLFPSPSTGLTTLLDTRGLSSALAPSARTRLVGMRAVAGRRSFVGVGGGPYGPWGWA